ncbi:hypothetical protein [Mucilaginibacter sp.]|uniref:hypothetical protein n=1 Tax=Mucilaginibacter sp. TaxID=1882438 RepID=UPI003D0FC3EB
MRYWCYTLFIVCLCVTFKASAQETFTLQGVISRNISTERLAQVIITNLRSKDIMMSDQLGWFTIKAAVGDTILFKKRDYADLRITINAKQDIPVYMTPVITLNEVRVNGQSKKQELNEIMGDYRKKGTFYDGKPPVLSFLTSPLTGIYELFGKTPGQARRFARDTKSELEYAEVRRRYNINIVKRVTNTTDTVAKKFMEYYTPSFEDLKGWNDYELIKHIRASYAYYDKSDDKQKLQSINAPTFVDPKRDTIKGDN